MSNNNGFYVIIVAAGNGTRCVGCGSLQPKQYFMVDGVTPLEYVVRRFLSMKIFCKVIVVVHKSHNIFFSKIKNFFLSQEKVILLESDSKDRSESVIDGLKFLKACYDDCKYVLIHDAVRYLVTYDMITRVFSPFLGANQHKIFATSMYSHITNSILYKNHNSVFSSINRDDYISLQTPQMFKFPFILNVYKDNTKKYSDDFSIIADKYPENIVLVSSNNVKNCKITNNNDLDDFYIYIKYYQYYKHISMKSYEF